MNENYYALIISVLLCLTPEQSFELLNTGRIAKRCDPKDVEDMVKFQSIGMTYRELAEAYGISIDTAFHRVSRWKKRRPQLCSM